MASQQVHLTADHAVPIPTGTAGAILVLVNGDSFFYDQTAFVTADSTEVTDDTPEVIANGPVWALSASNSDVTVELVDATQAITGDLDGVTDAAAKAVLTSVVGALVAVGVATDGTD